MDPAYRHKQIWLDNGYGRRNFRANLRVCIAKRNTQSTVSASLVKSRQDRQVLTATGIQASKLSLAWLSKSWETG